MSDAATDQTAPHIPVLLRPLLSAVAPVSGRWLDGTFGAGGYTRGLLDAGAAHVTGVDRDPLAFEMAQGWLGDYGDRIDFVADVFSNPLYVCMVAFALLFVTLVLLRTRTEIRARRMAALLARERHQ